MGGGETVPPGNMTPYEVELAAAVVNMAEELTAAKYRAFVLEQTVLRLLEHLAKTESAAAVHLADEVKRKALDFGNDRDSPLEHRPQEDMLDLVNLVQKAARPPA